LCKRSNVYTHPTEPITASIESTSATSYGCYIANNGTSSASLVCKNIPTTNGTVGVHKLLLNIDKNGSTPYIEIKEKPPVATEITAANLELLAPACDNSTLFVGEETTCRYKLKGSIENWYTITNKPITASISTSSATSYGCSIVGNYTPDVFLECKKVPSTNVTSGIQYIKTNLDGDNLSLPIEIKIRPPVATIIAEKNTSNGSCRKEIVIKGKKINNCSFLLTGDSNNFYTLTDRAGLMQKFQHKLSNLRNAKLLITKHPMQS
jgi:hypothetical protein